MATPEQKQRLADLLHDLPMPTEISDEVRGMGYKVETPAPRQIVPPPMTVTECTTAFWSCAHCGAGQMADHRPDCLVMQERRNVAMRIGQEAEGHDPTHKRPEGPMDCFDAAQVDKLLSALPLSKKDQDKHKQERDELPRAKSRDQYWREAD